MVKGVSLQTEGNGGVGVISDVGLFGKLRWGAGGGEHFLLYEWKFSKLE